MKLIFCSMHMYSTNYTWRGQIYFINSFSSQCLDKSIYSVYVKIIIAVGLAWGEPISEAEMERSRGRPVRLRNYLQMIRI